MNLECIKILESINDLDTKNELIEWVRSTAGSSNLDYFMCEKPGGLKLQQVPEEYAAVLFEIKSLNPKSYLEIGIGNGGSWMTCSYFLRHSLEKSRAVDNLAYYQAIDQKIEEIEFVENFLRSTINDVSFFNSDSKIFLDSHNEKYDVIFIDGDHSYEGVKKDFLKCLKNINPEGVMIFHDIASVGAPGVVQFWEEVKTQYKSREFIHSNTCGMGIIYF
jgi:predicted O-methyltransferase YrrM